MSPTAEPFAGVIGESWRESTPWWPPLPTPPAGAPNVLLVVLDDVGYAQLGCYGSDIETPSIDQLARDGTRLANFHTTALCSPTRACLLTGRNHHRVGMGRVADLAMGYPGYWGVIGREHGFLSEILGEHGYVSTAVGKWHLTPEDETHMAAPRSTWPVHRGFQRWYGFHGGETHQFVPTLFEDNHWVAPPASPEDGYHLSEDLADRAIGYLGDIRSVDASSPFFLYFALGACHSPHHAPADRIEHYRGRFDDGWDAARDRTFARQLELGLVPPSTQLSPRPPWVPAWSSLSAEEQRVAARFMECFAAFLSHADEQIGRVLAFVRDGLRELDDTIVVLVSDNGASAEGGPQGSINDARMWNGIPAGRRELQARIDELGGPTAHNNYPWGWTMAGNTPFKRWKREVHEGGVADPCIIRWPGRVAAGEIRHQYVHAIDVLPTILELAGISAPEALAGVSQSPIDGRTFGPCLADGTAPAERQTQYFEMLGSRAIYHDGWKAVAFHPLGRMYGDGLDPDAPFSEDRWELYHVAEDLTECTDLATAEPDRLQALVARWWDEARANQVLPLDNRPFEALLNPRPSRLRDRSRYVYHPHRAPVPESVAVNVRNRSHTISVELRAGTADRDGVLVAQGSVLGGWSLFVEDGRLHYVHNLAGKTVTHVAADRRVRPEATRLGFAFELTEPFTGIGRLYVDGALAGEGVIAGFTPARFSITGSGLMCGYDVGPAVAPDYVSPFAHPGGIVRAVIDVSGAPYRDLDAELAAILAEQ